MDDARFDAIINIVYNNDKAMEALDEMADRARLSYKEIEKASKQLERVQRDELDAYDNLIKERTRIDDAYEKHMREVGKGQIQEQRDELEAYERLNKARADTDRKREREYAAHLKILNKEHSASGKILLDIDKANADALTAMQRAGAKAADAAARSQRSINVAALRVQNKEDADAEAGASNAIGKSLRDRTALRMAALKNDKAATLSYYRATEIMAKDHDRELRRIEASGRLRLSPALRVAAGASVAAGQYNLGGAMYAAANIAQTLGTTIPIAAGIAAASVLAVGTAFGYALVQGEKFDVALHDTATLLTELKPGSAAFHDAMETLAKDAIMVSNLYGTDLIDVMKSFKTALSSGIEVNQLEMFGRTAATLATALGTSMDKATNVLTTFKDTYGLEVAELTKVSSMLFNVIDIGKVTSEGLLKNIGRVAPIAAQAGISLRDLNGGIATLSRVMNESQSTTAYTNFIRALVNPSKQAKLELDRLGIAYGDLAFKNRTLAEVVREVRDKVGTDAGAMGKIFEDQFAKRGAAAFTQLLPLLESASVAMDRMGTDTQAAGVKMDTFTAQFAKDVQRLKNSLTELGSPGLMKTLYEGAFGTEAEDFLRRLNAARDQAAYADAKASGKEAPKSVIAGRVSGGSWNGGDSERDTELGIKEYEVAVNRIAKIDALYVQSSKAKAEEIFEANKHWYNFRYFTAKDLNDHLVELEKERLHKVANLEQTARAVYNPASIDPAIGRAAEERAKQVGFHIRDDQRERYAEMKADVAGAADYIAKKLEFYKTTNPMSKELSELIDKMQALSDIVNNSKNSEAIRQAAGAELETLKVVYDQKFIAYTKDYQAYEHALEKKAVLDVEALRAYEESILGQQNRLDAANSAKRLEAHKKYSKKILDIDKNRIATLASIEQNYLNVIAAFKDRHAVLENQKKQSDDDIKDDDSTRRNRDKYDIKDSGRGNNTNWRKLREELDQIRADMEAALNSGDSKSFEMLRSRALSVFGEFRAAKVADGAGDKQFQAGGANSFGAMFGDILDKGNTKITQELRDKASATHQLALNKLTREQKEEEKKYQDEVKNAVIEGNDAEREAADTLQKILLKSAATTKPTDEKPTGKPKPVDGKPVADTDIVPPNPADSPVFDNGSANDYVPNTDTNGGANDYEGDEGESTHEVFGNAVAVPASSFGDAAAKSLNYRSVSQTSSQSSNTNSSNTNITVNATDPTMASRIKNVISSAMDTYHKSQNVQASTNGSDVRANNVYSPITASQPKASRRY